MLHFGRNLADQPLANAVVQLGYTCELLAFVFGSPGTADSPVGRRPPVLFCVCTLLAAVISGGGPAPCALMVM